MAGRLAAGVELQAKLHFIAGMPRAGSTLLAAILRQNPKARAEMTSPVGAIFNACLTTMGSADTAAAMDDDVKRRVLKGVFDSYYADADDSAIVFDTNRMWPARLPAIGQLYPEARIICCVRNPAWVMDSVERIVRTNAFSINRMFESAAERATVYSRADALIHANRLIGVAWAALKEAYYGADSERLLLVDYDLLAAKPDAVLPEVYRFIGEPPFDHDFDHVEYEAKTFDERVSAEGLHTVKGKVELTPRPTVLPPDLFRRLESMTFWRGDDAGTRATRLLAP